MAFLDDELYQIAKKQDYSNWQARSKARDEMQKCIQDRIKEQCKKLVNTPGSSDQDILVFLKRCRASWYLAIKKLEKEGILLYFGTDGNFENIIRECPYFQDNARYVLDKLNK